jgi:tyrosine-specific transport protein
LNSTATLASKHFVGATLLIAGSCIGAGMLGLPVLSGSGGFIPSVVIFVFCWLYMVCTGLLLLEVNLWFKEDVSIVSMAQSTLGTMGKVIAWSTFLFLFYSLNVAYIAGLGILFRDFVQDWTGVIIEPWIGSLLSILIFGAFTYLGAAAVDRCNQFMMLGLGITYLGLVALGSRYVDKSLLAHSNWTASLLVIPAVILSFGYHNLIPSMTYYLQHDGKLLRRAVILGSLLPLLAYLVWQWLILGIVPEGHFVQALSNEEMATQSLRNVIGASWVVDMGQYFAFFAIVTSFIGVALSFVDFLADGLKIKKTRSGSLLLVVLVLVPPFVFSLLYPAIFLTALRYAGGFGTVILFGILPALMVWRGRYKYGMRDKSMLPGGRVSLVLVILISIAVMGLQLLQELGWIASGA